MSLVRQMIDMKVSCFFLRFATNSWLVGHFYSSPLGAAHHSKPFCLAECDIPLQYGVLRLCRYRPLLAGEAIECFPLFDRVYITRITTDNSLYTVDSCGFVGIQI